MLHILAILLFLQAPLSVSQNFYTTPTNGSILITISNIRTNKGKVNVSLFAKGDGFPSNIEKAVALQTVVIQQNKVSLRFDNLPFGTYAVACLHDENGNGKMDTNLVGIPKEGYGASNNAVNKFSAPKFEAAKFPFNAAVLSVNFKMHYW
ncbi:MAG: DUF2141 domain-containing protein [Saprospiraceae bacterium]|nr:DUF2141 domain-containing protein [Saprospiraceae bacterium]